MANTYLISDTYFKEQYPAYNELDMDKFRAALLIEQQTRIEDWIGTILYAWLIENAGGTFTGDQLSFLEQVQYILVFATALNLIALNNTPTGDYKFRIDTLNEKLAYLKGKLLGFIEESDDETDPTSIIYIINYYINNGGSGTGGSGATPDADPVDSVIYYWRK